MKKILFVIAAVFATTCFISCDNTSTTESAVENDSTAVVDSVDSVVVDSACTADSVVSVK